VNHQKERANSRVDWSRPIHARRNTSLRRDNCEGCAGADDGVYLRGGYRQGGCQIVPRAGDFTAGILASGGVDWGVAAYFGSMAGVGAALLIVGAVVGIRARHRGAPVAS
jgi:hypothetical protein